MQIVGQNFNLKYLKILIVLIFLVLICIPLFIQLDSFALRLWDESRMANNALEMYQNHHGWVLYFDGKPDFWNTKPPLVTWIHVGMFSMFGISDMALRIPSALAGLAVILFISVFIYRKYQDLTWGLLSGFILVTSLGFVRMHGTRTCEYDAMLSIFTTGYVLFFWLFLEERKSKHWILFTGCLVLACFTKGIGGFLFIPGLFLSSLLLTKQFYKSSNWKYYVPAVLIFCLLIFGYYLFREAQTPGYLKAVYENELGGRYLKTNEGHEGDIAYYLGNMGGRFYLFWFPFFLVALVSGFFYKEKKHRKLHVFLSLNIFIFWLIISLGSSKLEWYDLPLYPLMAILTGLFLSNIIRLLLKIDSSPYFYGKWILPVLVVVLVFSKPYRMTIENINKTSRNDWNNYDDCLPFYLKKTSADTGSQLLKDCFVVDYGYIPHVAYYMKVLNLQQRNFNFKKYEEILPGDRVITRMDISKEFIESHFNYSIVDEKSWVKVYQIESLK